VPNLLSQHGLKAFPLTVVKLSYNSSGTPPEFSTNYWQQVTGLHSHAQGIRGRGKKLLLSNQNSLVHAKNLFQVLPRAKEESGLGVVNKKIQIF